MAVTELKRTLELPWEQTREKVIEALKTEGFGVLTEINVKETLKNKLDVDFRKYAILGACNPPLAHQALSTVTEIGVLLPCNVIVYEEDATHTTVATVDPRATIARAGVAGVEDIAEDVRGRLERMLEKLG